MKQPKLTNDVVWGLFFLLTLALTVFFTLAPSIHFGGDLVEYYGMTESIINHGGVNLTAQDQTNLERVINPDNFKDPQYYISGQNGNRYPVHFIFYSLMATGTRLFLTLLGQDPLNALRLLNFIIFSTTAFIFLQYFLETPAKKLVFLLTFYLSPLIYFIVWPGPDLYYACLLLIAVVLFYKNKFFGAALLTVLASWHSQPLVMMALPLIAFYFWKQKDIAKSALLVALLGVPYGYNLYAFGVLTPWTILKDAHTVAHGFGLQNASPLKLFEQFFDLNMGLFWYAPVVMIAGLWFALKNVRLEKINGIVILVMLITAIFYQTNPAWHYGTSGFGPTRHILFALVICMFFFIRGLLQSRRAGLILVAFIITQLYVLSFNGWLVPDFIKVLYHSPYATYVLNNFPDMYNPTPEIFMDRSNHTDTVPHSAVYMDNGLCKKAYILKSESDPVLRDCGFIPKKYLDQFTKLKDDEGMYITY